MMALAQKYTYYPAEFNNLWPERIDIFTLMASMATLILMVLMIQWLNAMFKKSARSGDAESTDENSNDDFSYGDTKSESEPLEVKIGRPWHTLSLPDKLWCYRAERSRRNSETVDDRTLKIVWEKTPSGAISSTYNLKQDLESATCADRFELISSIPMTAKKLSRLGHENEPMALRVHVQPIESSHRADSPSAIKCEDSQRDMKDVPPTESDVVLRECESTSESQKAPVSYNDCTPQSIISISKLRSIPIVPNELSQMNTQSSPSKSSQNIINLNQLQSQNSGEKCHRSQAFDA